MQIRKAPTWSTVGVADDESHTSSCGVDTLVEFENCAPRYTTFIYEDKPNASDCYEKLISEREFFYLMKPSFLEKDHQDKMQGEDISEKRDQKKKEEWKTPAFLQDELDAIAAVAAQPGVRERYKQLSVTVISVLNRIFGKANISIKGGPGSIQTGNFEDGPTLIIIGRPKDTVDLETFKWWEEADMWGHIRADDHDDPFYDFFGRLRGRISYNADRIFCKNTFLHRAIRAEFSSTNFAIDVSQFRTHIFSFIIVGRYARFMYWECCGRGICSHRFDYTKRPESLLEFFVRFSALDRQQRGYDSSVQDASPEEIETANAYFGSLQNGWMNDQVTWHKLTIPSEKPSSFIIPHQRYQPTRYFSSERPSQVKIWPAYDLSRKMRVVLKDRWILVPSQFTSEWEFNKTLADAKGKPVQTLPVICIGDVKFRPSSFPWCIKEVFCYLHDRQAIRADTITLSQSSDVHSICSALRNSIHTFSEAYSEFGPTYPDIQCSKVIIRGNESSFLGWENPHQGCTNLRRRTKKQKWELKFHQRAMLPKFTSVSCLSHENLHRFLDDLESISNIMVWLLLVVSVDKDTLSQGANHYDHMHSHFAGGFNGTVTYFKEIVSKKTRINKHFSYGENELLQNLVGDVNHLFAARYQAQVPKAEDLEFKLRKQRGIENKIRQWLKNNFTALYYAKTS